MESIADISHNEVKNVNEKLICQDAKMCDFQKDELNLFDEEMTLKDELEKHQKRFNEFQRQKEDININLKQTNFDYLSIKDCLSKKLEMLNLTVSSLRAEHDKLNNDNTCLKDQLKTLNTNEGTLAVDMEKLETYKKKLENEYDNQGRQLEKSRREVETLAKRLKCARDEATGARDRLEESQAAAGRSAIRCKRLEADVTCAAQKLCERQEAERELADRCAELEADVERARSAREDARLRAAATEARLAVETAALARRLECRARELQETEAECGEAARRAADLRCRANRNEALAADLRAACERERREAAERAQRLERDACRRDAEALRLGEQLAAACRDADEAARLAATHETRALAYEKVVDSARQSADARDSLHDEARDRLERDVAALSAEARRMAAAVAELERQAGKLREEIDCD